MGFLDEYMKRGQKPSKLSPHVIRHNRFDNEDYQSVKRQIDKFAVAHDQLAEVAETGYEAMQDTWYSFFKVDPEFLEDGEIRPKFLVNKRVMDEARELDDFKKLRDFSAGDDVGSAIGATTIEPDLESLFERDEMKQAQQKANHLDEILEELLGMDGEDGMAAYGEGEGEQQEGGAQPQNLQEDQEKIEELRKALQEKAEKAEKDLNDALDQAKKEMKARLQQALNRAAREAETTMTSADSWGLGRSEFIRLPANKRF